MFRNRTINCFQSMHYKCSIFSHTLSLYSTVSRWIMMVSAQINNDSNNWSEMRKTCSKQLSSLCNWIYTCSFILQLLLSNAVTSTVLCNFNSNIRNHCYCKFAYLSAVTKLISNPVSVTPFTFPFPILISVCGQFFMLSSFMKYVINSTLLSNAFYSAIS